MNGGAFDGEEVANAPTLCVEKTCENVNCGARASCSEMDEGDGFQCSCDSEYKLSTVWNSDQLTCEQRTCTNPGFSDAVETNNCGDFATCRNLPDGYGVACSCEGGFEGDTRFNERADCVEKSCASVNCGVGATCYDDDSLDYDGYVCKCNAGYHTDEAWNGDLLQCVERTCDLTGFSSGNTCGPHATCKFVGGGNGIQCTCEGAFEGDSIPNNPTSCIEKTCSSVDAVCGSYNASCSNAGTDDGFKCTCDQAFFGADAWNGDIPVCVERTCSSTGFDDSITGCGEHAYCSESSSGQGITCACDDAYDGPTVLNEPAVCTEKTCNIADCGESGDCFEGGNGDGYFCKCRSAFISDVENVTSFWNTQAACRPRRCDDMGFASCGENAICVNTANGITCRCVNDAFEGGDVENGPTSCVEKTLALIHI